MKLIVFVLPILACQLVSGFSKDYFVLISELPEFLDDTVEQVIKNSLTCQQLTADRALFAFPVRNIRSIELECVNRLDERSCNYLASSGYCNLRRDSMEIYCRRACKICTDPPCHISKYGCCLDNTTLARGPNMLGCNDDCKDRLGKTYCRNLKRSGKCYEDHDKAIRECAVTCGYCRPCEDEDPVGCMFAAKYDGCSLKRGEMTNICRKSCDACGKKDPCFEFSCPKGSVCLVDENMRPFCKCHGHCHPGDHYTGILCGRDGKEYKNICELKKVNCGHHSLSRITVKNFGKCQARGFAASDKRQLCSKKEPVLCRNWAARGYCKTRSQILRKMCPQSCHVCAAHASKPSCHYTKYGCCLDNKTPCKGTDYKGCPKFPACRDFARTFCKRFVPVCGSDNHKGRMALYCPKSCEICH